MLCETEWSWELRTWSHKMNFLDISSTSPHHFFRKWIGPGRTNENSNFDPRASRVKRDPTPALHRKHCLHWRKPRGSTFGPTTDWGVVFRSHPSCNSMDYQHYSGRKNVLRKLLRILYRRLKAGFFCVWNDFVCLCRSDELNARDANVCYLYKAFVFVLCFVTWNLLWIQNTDVGEDFTR